jgi:hypothetical protein
MRRKQNKLMIQRMLLSTGDEHLEVVEIDNLEINTRQETRRKVQLLRARSI